MGKKSIFALALSTTVALTAVLAAERPASHLAEDQMAGIVRTINACQMSWAARYKGFATLRDLKHGKYLNECGVTINYDGSDSATVEDYDLRIIVSADGRHYSTSLTPTTGCGISMFSNELGIIYRATAFGC